MKTPFKPKPSTTGLMDKRIHHLAYLLVDPVFEEVDDIMDGALSLGAVLQKAYEDWCEDNGIK